MRLRKNRKTTNREQGVALIVALLALLILTTLAAAIIFVTQTETWASSNFKLVTQARYAAEAGAQNTANWLIYTYTFPTAAQLASYNLTTSPVTCLVGCATIGGPVVLSAITGANGNYPDSRVRDAFHDALNNIAVPGVTGATYATTATMLSLQQVTKVDGTKDYLVTWQITSLGTLGGVRPAQVQVVENLERPGTSLLNYAAYADGNNCPALTMAGGSTTDSYNSSLGTYPAGQENALGNVGTNGSITLPGSGTVVNGQASVVNLTNGPCSPMISGAGTTQGNQSTGAPITFPTPPASNPLPPTTNQNINSNTTLTPNTYGNLQVTAGATLTLAPGTYNINSISMAGNSNLTISPPGQVIINVTGASQSTPVDLTGGTLNNTTGDPNNFQINYGGTGNVKLSGGAGCAAICYAPNASVALSGGAPWYGAIVSNNFSNSGGSALHYDRNLANDIYNIGLYHVTSFTWSKF